MNNLENIVKRLLIIVCMICAIGEGSLHAQNDIHIENLLSQIDADSLLRTVTDLQNFGSRFALRDGDNQQVSEYLVQRLQKYGVMAELDSFHKSGDYWLTGAYDQTFYNVRGVLPAVNAIDDSLVLIGAHLDAISYDHETYMPQENAPGADDNASGVAVMIEIARICHENGLRFHRNVHFMAFDGEELGLFGSYYDAQKRYDEGDKIAVMLNNDMVSYQPDDNWRLMLHWYPNAQDIVSRAAEICTQYTNITPVVPSISENANAEYSDSYAYYQSGFRAVFAMEYTFSLSYHTDCDVADSNNYAYLADVARYNLAMLNEYAGLDDALGVETHKAESQMLVSPNPVSDRAMVWCPISENSTATYTITDMTGRVLLQQKICGQTGGHYEEMDLSGFPPGIYLCQLRTNVWTNTMKIVKL